MTDISARSEARATVTSSCQCHQSAACWAASAVSTPITMTAYSFTKPRQLRLGFSGDGSLGGERVSSICISGFIIGALIGPVGGYGLHGLSAWRVQRQADRTDPLPHGRRRNADFRGSCLDLGV